MAARINLDKIYTHSEDIVAREIQGEFILIPITSGVGDPDLQDAIFTLNETGRIIWDRLDGKKKLKEIAVDLVKDYDIHTREIEKDISGFTQELLKRRMLIAIKRIRG